MYVTSIGASDYGTWKVSGLVLKTYVVVEMENGKYKLRKNEHPNLQTENWTSKSQERRSNIDIIFDIIN